MAKIKRKASKRFIGMLKHTYIYTVLQNLQINLTNINFDSTIFRKVVLYIHMYSEAYLLFLFFPICFLAFFFSMDFMRTCSSNSFSPVKRSYSSSVISFRFNFFKSFASFAKSSSSFSSESSSDSFSLGNNASSSLGASNFRNLLKR